MSITYKNLKLIAPWMLFLKTLIFQARPACTVITRLWLHMRIGWSSLRFLWEPEPLQWRNDILSFRRWDYSSILRVAVSPIHKYRSEQSLYFYRHSLHPMCILSTLSALNSIENYYYHIEFRMIVCTLGRRHCFKIAIKIKHLLKKGEIFYLPPCHVTINQHQRNREHANVILNYWNIYFKISGVLKYILTKVYLVNKV